LSRIVPQGVDASTFNKALDELAAVVGKQWVFLDELPLSAYRDAYSPLADGEMLPSAAVAPDGVEQIQKILAVVNAYKIPVWTIGTGRNFAYGGPAPRKSGYVMLDLRRMNRVIEVNEKYGYALVEPGVSYMQLYRHLRQIGSKLWIDPAAPAWGGVIGNALEHGAGYTPYGDHFVMQCGMEVVLADGEIVRTGQGALAGSKHWQVTKHVAGPHFDGMFTQSNFGVVTKMGIWLMPEPPSYKPFMITYQKEEDLERSSRSPGRSRSTRSSRMRRLRLICCGRPRPRPRGATITMARARCRRRSVPRSPRTTIWECGTITVRCTARRR